LGIVWRWPYRRWLGIAGPRSVYAKEVPVVTWIEAVALGWFLGVMTVVFYVRGKLMERWYVTGRPDEEMNSYEVQLRKGNKTMVVFRVLFQRGSSPNPDTSFSDQLAQATADAEAKAASLNAAERRNRDLGRKSGTPGGIV
jgi:hypothetical protein